MIFIVVLTIISFNLQQFSYATTESPTLQPSVSPTGQPTRSPTASPTLFPTVLLTPSNLGYYYSSRYFGITCNNVVGNEYTITEMSGNSFGNCLVGYNESGYPLESSSYVSSCELEGGDYVAYYTEYSDNACKIPKSAPTKIYYQSGCSTSGDYTTQYYCIPSSKYPPFQSLSGGYVTGYTSTLSDCKNGLPHTFTWQKKDECVEEYSSSTNLNTSELFTCNSDSVSQIRQYNDGTCNHAVSTQTARVSLCQFQYYSSEPYNNYIYGNCQGSHSSSSNDDVTMTNDDYAGIITGTLLAGIILGSILGAIVLIVCCKFSKV